MEPSERERWVRLVADYEASDLRQREFALERGIRFNQLRNWIYRLRAEGRARVEPAGQKEDLRLLPVRVVASAPRARPSERSEWLELVLQTGTRLRFSTGTDIAYVGSLARALQRC